MIIICIALIASSLGRMTLPFCEHNRESLIRALAAMGHPAKQGGGLIAPPARLQTSDWRGFFSLDDSAMDDLNRFRNVVLAAAAAAVTFGLINEWAQTLDILADPLLWLESLMAPRPN